MFVGGEASSSEVFLKDLFIHWVSTPYEIKIDETYSFFWGIVLYSLSIQENEKLARFFESIFKDRNG